MIGRKETFNWMKSSLKESPKLLQHVLITYSDNQLIELYKLKLLQNEN